MTTTQTKRPPYAVVRMIPTYCDRDGISGFRGEAVDYCQTLAYAQLRVRDLSDDQGDSYVEVQTFDPVRGYYSRYATPLAPPPCPPENPFCGDNTPPPANTCANRATFWYSFLVRAASCFSSRLCRSNSSWQYSPAPSTIRRTSPCRR